ncbi:MAG: type II toxin-antitoxin system VapC family toxin [Candidatus Bathyarchaeia archaeon]
MLKVYLDSSAIVKRYISEPGTSAADKIFDKCWEGELLIATSIWNIGEVLGVFDVRRRRKWLNEDEFNKTLMGFLSEITGLLRLKSMEIIPVLTSVLVEGWPLILEEHIYEADALQIQTCIYSESKLLLSADEDLINTALKKGVRAINIKDESKVEASLRTAMKNSSQGHS